MAPQDPGNEPGTQILPFGSTVYQRVHEHLRSEILGGRIAPGTRLKIDQIASRFGLSHMPVREALQQLQGEGLVLMSPNRGATVRAIDLALLRNLFGVGEALQGYLAREAAHRIDAAGLEALRRLQAEMGVAAAAQDRVSFGRLNRDFHHRIAQTADNPEAVRLADMPTGLVLALRQRFGYGPARYGRVLDEHEDLIEALARRDGAAAQAIHDRHMRAALDDLLARIADAEPGGSPGMGGPAGAGGAASQQAGFVAGLPRPWPDGRSDRASVRPMLQRHPDPTA